MLFGIDMKIGDKVTILINHYTTWRTLGEGIYLGSENIYHANGGYMWKEKAQKAKFKKGIIIAGNEFRICKQSSRSCSQSQVS